MNWYFYALFKTRSNTAATATTTSTNYCYCYLLNCYFTPTCTFPVFFPVLFAQMLNDFYNSKLKRLVLRQITDF